VLDELSVRNLGIIAATRLEPGPGLVVVSGETGAGKTLLLGALRLLCGETARPDLIGPEGDETTVEARFFLGDDEVTVTRQVLREGRSRAYLDGSPVPARVLAERIGTMVEIVGQHDHQALSKPAEVRALVDRLLDDVGLMVRDAYRSTWERAQSLSKESEALGGGTEAVQREAALARFQAAEIAAAGFVAGEDAELERMLSRLRHLEELTERLAAAHAAATTAGDTIGDVVAVMRRAAMLDQSLEPLAKRAEESQAVTGDLTVELRAAADALEGDPRQLAELEERLALLNSLRRKYGATLEEVLAFGEETKARADEVERLLTRAEQIEEELAEASRDLDLAGTRLRESRAAAGGRLAKAARGHLRQLGFSDPHLEVEASPAQPGPEGAEVIRLLFASDSRLVPSEVGRVASGGELSRLILALRLGGGAGRAPVVAFDEVDAGVGGRTALALGAKLAELAADRQVLCVTHLPQVAAFADTHAVVHRDGSSATVELVDGAGRLEELSRMLSGLPESERGREHAEELLAIAAGGSVG
jgi:DNA repair protein RecN (Recombination protein N)